MTEATEFDGRDERDERDDEPPTRPAPHPLVALDQRRHLRRILQAFGVMVVLLPIAGLGGGWSWLVLPLVVIAALALREAIRLRRSVREHGHALGGR